MFMLKEKPDLFARVSKKNFANLKVSQFITSYNEVHSVSTFDHRIVQSSFTS